MTTPMMQQYLQIKQQHQTHLLFFRMGDFYELFFDDAKTAHHILGIALSHRGQHDGMPVPMAGVPHHSSEPYVQQLLAHGYSVAVCEQIGVPQAKGIVDRAVVRIITAGTVVDGGLMEQKDPHYLVSIDLQKNQWVCAWLSLAQGNIFVQTHPLDSALLALGNIQAKECIYNAAQHPHIEALKQHHSQTKVCYNAVPSWYYQHQAAHMLTEHFQTQDLSVFGIDAAHMPAIASLLRYIQETQGSIPAHVSQITCLRQQTHMILDGDTLKNLEVFQNIHSHKNVTLYNRLDTCVTSMGSRFLRQELARPHLDMDAIQARYAAIDALYHIDASAMAQVFKGIYDIERINARIALARATPKDLIQLRSSLQSVQKLACFLDDMDSALCSRMYCHFTSEKIAHITQALAVLFNASEPKDAHLAASDVNALFITGYHVELDQAYHLQQNIQQILKELEQSEREKTRIHNLRIEHNRVHGFYIEVSGSHVAKVPAEYQRQQSLKNSERFITPYLKELEEKFLHAQECIQTLEKNLYEALLQDLACHIPDLKKLAQDVAQLDMLLAFTRQAKEKKWVKPQLHQGNSIEIMEGKHPVVAYHQVEHFVANDTVLGPARRMLLITGPNMGGKSTYMRQVALIVIMAYVGCFVPAKRAHIGKIERIFSRIGASDDVAGGHSTFMVEMLQTATILQQATMHSLVLLDEVGRGTSTFDGLGLAYAIAQRLVEKNQALSLFATHYFELTQLAQQQSKIANVHVHAIEHDDKIVFMHQVKPGPAHQSYGIQVAKLAGVPPDVIAQAKAHVYELEKQHVHQTSSQMNLLYEPDAAQALQDAILALDVDNISQTQAKDFLMHWQLKLKL